ncbi:MAG: hypothetical protein IJ286_05910 [Alistipes sp.]|nr:hypothetical protein [Alistipes sp.]
MAFDSAVEGIVSSICAPLYADCGLSRLSIEKPIGTLSISTVGQLFPST